MKIWIYLNGLQQGPYSIDQLRLLPITPQTPVWYEGLAEWTPAAKAPALAAWFNGGDIPVADDSDHSGPSVEIIIEKIHDKPDQSDAQHSDAAPRTDIPADMPDPQRAEFQLRPPTSMVWCILLTVLCCSPIALAGIITGSLSSSRYNQGDIKASRKFSEATEWLLILAIVFAIIGLPVALACNLLSNS